MAGHSKWANIKHRKGRVDASRAKLFTKLARELIVASKEGGGDPSQNPRLRIAIQKAKDSNMPNERINTNIEKATGKGKDGEQIFESQYEGYGPDGTGFIVHTLTENKNRTISALRSTFAKSGGNLAESGAVSWQFEEKGLILLDTNETDEENLALDAIDLGAEDVNISESILEVVSDISELEGLKSNLEKKGYILNSYEIALIPKSSILLDHQKSLKILKLLDILNDLDDVQKVFTNADFEESALNEYANSLS
jgi:YebC/PmpR family DNA-binding regulatory protein